MSPRVTFNLAVWAAERPYVGIPAAFSYNPERPETGVRLAFLHQPTTGPAVETAVYTLDRRLLVIGLWRALTLDDVTVGPSRIPGWVGISIAQDDGEGGIDHRQVYAQGNQLEEVAARCEAADVDLFLARTFGEVTS